MKGGEVYMTAQTIRISKKRSMLWREIKRNRVAYAYISPFFILFAIFGLFPILSGLYISFFRWDGASAMKWKGVDNYIRLFTDPTFLKAVSNTLYIGIIAHIPILGGGLVLAYLLNGKFVKGRNIFRTVFFLPMVTSAVAITIVFSSMFGFNFGVLNYFLNQLGMDKIDWLGAKGQYIRTSVIIMFAWKWIGWNMVIYLAGMQGISNDIYEAATIDGARPSQTFLRITLPLLRPIILFTLIQSTIGMMNLFTEPFILTGGKGGIDNMGLTVMMYLLDKAPKGNNLYGLASAVAYVICMMVIVISLVFQKTLGGRNDLEKDRKGGRMA
jgi:ABC-type sugar transport system permease subunit